MTFDKAIDPRKSFTGKLLSVFVAVVMVVSMCPMPGFAKAVAADTITEDGTLVVSDLTAPDGTGESAAPAGTEAPEGVQAGDTEGDEPAAPGEGQEGEERAAVQHGRPSLGLG